MEPQTELEAEYRISLGMPRIIGLATLVSVLFGFMIYQAATNDRGLVLQGFLHLSQTQATLFYWAFSAILGFVALPVSVGILAKALFLPQRIAFSGNGLVIPASFWSRREIQIPFSDVRDLRCTEVRNEQILTLTLPGRKFRIGKSWLPSQEAFDDVLRRVEEGFRNSR